MALYLVAFFVYTWRSRRSTGCYPRPTRDVVCAAATVAAQLIVFYRKRVLSAMAALRFDEEDPQAIFQGFQLSEALAAHPKPPDGVNASPEFRASPVP